MKRAVARVLATTAAVAGLVLAGAAVAVAEPEGSDNPTSDGTGEEGVVVPGQDGAPRENATRIHSSQRGIALPPNTCGNPISLSSC